MELPPNRAVDVLGDHRPIDGVRSTSLIFEQSATFISRVVHSWLTRESPTGSHLRIGQIRSIRTAFAKVRLPPLQPQTETIVHLQCVVQDPSA